MYNFAKEIYDNQLKEIKDSGLWKNERIVTTPQSGKINTLAKNEVLNFCANNYLGLASHPEVIDAAKASYDQWGYGMSSVRFIVGTQQIHKDLEKKNL